jgi:fucose 4-O-acetylase-like acetyltransferase
LQESTLLGFVDQWIYGFHMPLFFFISGLFVERSLSKPFKDFVFDKLCTIAYPYFVWSILQSILQVLGSRYTNDKLSLGDIWKIGYQPIMQFWFLYTLFFILLVYGILHKLKLPPVLFLIFAVLLYCLHGLNVSFGPWGVLYLFRRHAIYFALGVIVGSNTWLSSIKSQTNVFALISVVLGGYLAVGLAVELQLTENAIAIPFIAMLGIVASVILAILLEKFDLLPFVKKWGMFSLEIFVVHAIAASVFRIVLQKLFGFTEPVMHFLLGTVIAIYAPIILSVICSKLGFQYIFTLRSLKK